MKGGLIQRDPKNAAEIVERFGCFISYLIRSFPLEKTRDPQACQNFENALLKIVKKPIDQLLTRNRGEMCVLSLIYPKAKGNRLIDQNFIEVLDEKLN